MREAVASAAGRARPGPRGRGRVVFDPPWTTERIIAGRPAPASRRAGSRHPSPAGPRCPSPSTSPSRARGAARGGRSSRTRSARRPAGRSATARIAASRSSSSNRSEPWMPRRRTHPGGWASSVRARWARGSPRSRSRPATRSRCTTSRRAPSSSRGPGSPTASAGGPRSSASTTAAPRTGWRRRIGRLRRVGTLDAVADGAFLVIEAAVEDLALKRVVFATLDARGRGGHDPRDQHERAAGRLDRRRRVAAVADRRPPLLQPGAR